MNSSFHSNLGESKYSPQLSGCQTFCASAQPKLCFCRPLFLRKSLFPHGSCCHMDLIQSAPRFHPLQGRFFSLPVLRVRRYITIFGTAIQVLVETRPSDRRSDRSPIECIAGRVTPQGESTKTCLVLSSFFCFRTASNCSILVVRPMLCCLGKHAF